jgi:predicted acetylornithine/succinylornithine family transaminase
VTTTASAFDAGQIRQSEAAHVLHTYRRAPIVLVRGQGARVWDSEGREYLDFTSGVGVAALGHANPGLAKVIAEQATILVHTSNLFFHPYQSELAEKLFRLSGLDRVFFCNSGTEAVEACLKFARRYWFTNGETSRTKFVALQHAFHGRTFGSLSVTADPHYRDPFGPLVGGVTFVDAADPASLDAAVTGETAAIVLEPIQGEGGVRPLSREFADAVRAAAERTGALVIADEVQSGLGRTGYAFYAQELGLSPDLMAIGKALGGGVPIGAALVRERIAAAVSPGDHGSTYGGNLLACRAALTFLDELENGLLDHVARVGAHLERGLRAMAARQSAIRDVRGAGLIWGIDIDRPAAAIVDAARERRLLVNRTSDTVIRLLPPYVISEREIDEALPLLEAAIASAVEGPRQ